MHIHGPSADYRRPMLTGPRFALYRRILAGALSRGFRDYPIEPLAQPVDTEIDHVAHDDLWPDLPLPGVRVAASFIPSDHAERRRTKIRVQMWLRGLLVKFAPKDTPPVPADERGFLDAVYPAAFDKAGVRRPVLPPELRDGPDGPADVLAELVVRGPFGSYLRRPTPEEVAAGEAGEDEYVVDLAHYLSRPAKPGLLRPGGKAVFAASATGLATRAVARDDAVPPDLARRAMVAGLNEDLTNFRHNLGTHNVVLTDVAIATINRLAAAHPVRRVLQHTFHTLLIGNLENCNAHFAGSASFSVTLFSHDAEQVAALAAAHLRDFDLLDLCPDLQFERRGTTETPFPYPYRDNVLELWAANLEYVRDYVAVYYPDDAAVAGDAALVGWAEELDRLLPNPVAAPRRAHPRLGRAGVRDGDPPVHGRARHPQQRHVGLHDVRLRRALRGAGLGRAHGPAPGAGHDRRALRDLAALQHALRLPRRGPGPRRRRAPRDARLARPAARDPGRDGGPRAGPLAGLPRPLQRQHHQLSADLRDSPVDR